VVEIVPALDGFVDNGTLDVIVLFVVVDVCNTSLLSPSSSLAALLITDGLITPAKAKSSELTLTTTPAALADAAVDNAASKTNVDVSAILQILTIPSQLRGSLLRRRRAHIFTCARVSPTAGTGHGVSTTASTDHGMEEDPPTRAHPRWFK